MPIATGVVYPAGQYGVTGASQTAEVFLNTGSAAIVAGDAVIIEIPADTGIATGVGCTTTTTADSNRVIGIALEAIAVGDSGLVCTWGIVRSANVATASAAGDKLSTSATAGRLATGTPAGGTTIALCLSTPASNVADVFVTKF